MIPLTRDLGTLNPWSAAKTLHQHDGFAFLDSGGDHGDVGRYSIIGVDPFGVFRVAEGQAFWNGEALPGAPLDRLRDCLGEFPMTAVPGFPFSGGAIGYVAYDFGQRLEKLAPLPASAPTDELVFGFYDLVLVFDRHTGLAQAISSGYPQSGAARAQRAARRLDQLRSWLEAPVSEPTGQGALGDWASNFDQTSYAAAVDRVIDHIRAGDIYQANIAQEFRAPISAPLDPFGVYAALRRANPAPFAAYLKFADTAFASSSPERFLQCRQGRVEARPIKGTAKRQADPQADKAAAEALQASEKDRAENVMIVDLLRNDLSRVCAPGSVDVPELCSLETYAGVHHLTSAVTGDLAEGEDAVSLLAATFPGGSITGAPKIAAQNIITAIEGRPRGIYCGSIGYIGFDGDMDLNIAIRTLTITPHDVVLQAGGGVTLLSDPVAEYVETLTKAQRIFDALAPFGQKTEPDPCC